MKAIIYLGMVIVMMMAFEVKAFDEFEESGVDVSSWLYQDTTTISEWEDFTTLANSRGQSLVIKEKTLKSKKTIVAVSQKLINNTQTPYCLIAALRDTRNAINTFLRSGRTIVLPGEERLLGGYRIHTMGRNWKVQWNFRATKNLNRCN